MIYTKTGDDGSTSLVDGQRVLKCDDRVEAYGTVDELNAHIGVVAEMVKPIAADHYYADLKNVQNNLFVIQTLLATENEDVYAKLPQLPEHAVIKLEQHIDEITTQLPKINSFVIPGGSLVGAQCHVARCICRRAERCIVRLQQHSNVSNIIQQYINRLSDYLFVLSRVLVLQEGKSENLWSSQ